jgi:hypothetical protein
MVSSYYLAMPSEDCYQATTNEDIKDLMCGAVTVICRVCMSVKQL